MSEVLQVSASKRNNPTRFYRDVVLAYDGDECLIWPYERHRGYARFPSGQSVVRRLCTEVLGDPPASNYKAVHSCSNGNMGCVTKAHMRWQGPKYQRPRTRPREKLTEAQVLQIRALRGQMLQREIAAKFGIDQANVSAIQRGKTWAWLA